MRSVLSSFLVLLGLLAFADVASAVERRVALVVGNSSYADAPLKNPKNDANDVADALSHLGFEVIRHIDAGRNEINDALEEFQRKAYNADAVLFYYAGHAMQYNGQNYLLPVDAVLKDQYSVQQLTNLSRIKDALATCDECVKIMILDACRNNPLADQISKEQAAKYRSLSNSTRGLARLSEKPEGMIVAYATQAGEIASDGDGRNSPFTQALLAELKKPELGLSELFNDVSLDVKTATGKTQVPDIDLSAVRNQFYLNQNEGDNTAFEKLDFSDVQALRRFVEKYPESSKRRVVESLVAIMERQARERAEEVQQEAEHKRLQAEEIERQMQANAEAQRARLAAEESAKRQADAQQKAESDRLKQEANAEAQRKLDAERARLAAEEDAKQQAEAQQKAESDRLKQEANAEAQRKLDAEHLGSADAPQQQANAAGDAVNTSVHPDLQQSTLATACTTERAQFVALKRRGVPSLKALATLKARLVCADIKQEVQAALEASSTQAVSQRQSASSHRKTPAPLHSFATLPTTRVLTRSRLQPIIRPHPELSFQQAQRGYHEQNRSDAAPLQIRLPPAPAVSASAPTVDFRGGGF